MDASDLTIAPPPPGAPPGGDRCPGLDLLLGRRHDLLDAQEQAEVGAHLAACPACAAALEALEQALAAPDAAAPGARAAWPGLAARLDALDAAPPGPAVAVRLRCTYCKDATAHADVLYCASCLAPHHAECFAEHGACAAAGCEGRRVVGTAPRPARRPRWRGPLLGAALLAGGLAGAAALRPGPAAPAPAPVLAVAAPGPAPGSEHQLVRYDLRELLAAPDLPAPLVRNEPEWIVEARRVLAARKVTLNFADTPLREVVSFLQDITGLNVCLAATLDGERAIQLRLRDVSLSTALDLICEQAGARVAFRSESVLLEPPGAGPAAAPRHPGERLEPAAGLDPQGVVEEVRGAVAAALGDDAWDPPASITIKAGQLVVHHVPRAHAAVRAWLAALGAPALPGALAGAWFAPAAPGLDPATSRADAVARRLAERHVTLSFDQTPLLEAVAFLASATDVAIRIAAAAEERAARERTTVTLRLRDLSAGNALSLVVASDEALTWDLDRDGVLIRRTDAPGLEARLAEAARRAAGRSAEARAFDDEVARQLERRTLSADLDGVPLSEALTFLSDLSGLNIVVGRGVDPEARVRLVTGKTTLGAALDRLLVPLDLGLRLDGGVLVVVPGDGAVRGGAVAALSLPLRERPLGATVDGDLAALAARLEQVLGVHVHCSDRFRRARWRLRLPAGLSVQQALDLARGQAGVHHGWARLDGRAALALDAPGAAPPVTAALGLARASAWPDAPPAARAALDQARGRLRAALLALAAAAGAALGPCTDQVRAAHAELEDVLAGHAGLAPPRAMPRPGRGGEDPTEALLAERDRLHGRLSAVGPDAARERADLEAEAGRLEARLAALEADPALEPPEARSAADPAAGVDQADPDAVEDARWSDRVARAQVTRSALRERLTILRRRQARVDRDLALETARLRSQEAQLVERLAELLASVPFADARGALARGLPWGGVFEGGYAAWLEAEGRRSRQAIPRGLRALDDLGVRVARDGAAWRLEAVSGLGRALGLEPGDLLRGAGGPLAGGWPELLGRLGDPRAMGRARTLEVARGGTCRTLRLPLGAVEGRPRARLRGVAQGADGALRVTDPTAAGPRAGLRPGDRVARVDDLPADDLEAALDRYAAGARLRLVVLRDGGERTLEVVADGSTPAD